MITLCLEKGAYFRVRKGVDKRDIERVFDCPVHSEVYVGAIIALPPEPSGFCYALPAEDYSSIAIREGVDEEELKKLNGFSPLYPTKKVWLPKRIDGV